jgi:hypothetical protein
VLEVLAAELPGAEIQLAEAQFQLFGGVRLHDLRLSRRDEPGAEPFAIFPEVILHPDREQLARGALVLRKIELVRPRLTLIRTAEGAWNLHGIVGGKKSARLPAVVIQHGTLILIDQHHQAPAQEISSLQATLLPQDPLTLQVKATGHSPLVGRIELDGTVDPDSGEFAAAYHLPKAVLGPPVQELLARYVPELKRLGSLEGEIELDGDLAYHPESSQPWSNTLHADLRNGRYQHPELPIPLTEVTGAAHCDGGRLVIEHLNARAEGAQVTFSAELQGLTGQGECRVHGKVEHLLVNDQLIARLPKRLGRIVEEFHPQGKLSLTGEYRRQNGADTLACTLRPEGMSATYVEFPYRVDGITGTLQFSEAGKTPIVRVNLEGLAEGQAVRLHGDVYGAGLKPDCTNRPGFNLEIHGSRVPIDERLLKALEPYPKTSETVAEFKPRGFVSILVNLQRQPGETPEERPEVDKRFVLNFHEARMVYQDFPYPVENIEGTLEIRADESWRFFDFRGRHKGGQFQGAGQSQPGPDGNRIRIVIHGQDALLDEEMERALDDEMKTAWRLFNPAGRVDFTAQIDCRGKGKPALDLRTAARNCRMKPTCFPYQLEHVQGSFHYVDDRVTVTDFSAQHGDGTITLKQADVALHCDGGYRSEFHQLRAEQLLVDEDLLDALPGMVRKAFATLQPDQPIRVVTDLILEENRGVTRYYWDGSVGFAKTRLQCGLEATDATGLVALRGSYDGAKLNAEGNVQLMEATVARLPLKNLRSTLKVTDQTLVLAGLESSVLGGQLYGPVRVNFTPEPEFHVDLTASQIDLETFARETLDRTGQVKGKASARLRLNGRGSDLKTLKGEGTLHIEDGARIYDLPLVLNLLTTLSGHLPKGSAFQEAHADLVIEGDVIKVPQVELLGDALSLRGQGDLRVDGSKLNLEMYGLLWGRTLPLLPPLIDRIPEGISRQLMKIRIQGSLGEVQVKKEPVPIIVEPVRELWKKMAEKLKEDEVKRNRRLP